MRILQNLKMILQNLKRLLKNFLPYGLVNFIQSYRNELKLSKGKVLSDRILELQREYGYAGLHMGCGPIRHKGYLNCDLRGGEYCVDASQHFPILTSSIDFVYSEHFIEHLRFDTGLFFLEESFRVLKKNGRIRILTPDLSMLIKIADDNNHSIANMHKEHLLSKYPSKYSLKRGNIWNHKDDIINSFIGEDWGHLYLWSAPHLAKAMKSVGFSKVEILPFCQSKESRILLDPPDRWGKEWTTAIEGIKI